MPQRLEAVKNQLDNLYQQQAAAKAEAERLAAENKKILRPTRPEKSLVQKRAAAAAGKPKSTKAKAVSDEKSAAKPAAARRTTRRTKASEASAA